jgi:hypothetical protein
MAVILAAPVIIAAAREGGLAEGRADGGCGSDREQDFGRIHGFLSVVGLSARVFWHMEHDRASMRAVSVLSGSFGETGRMSLCPASRLTAVVLIALLVVAFTTGGLQAREGRGGHGDHDEAMRYFESGKTLPLEVLTAAALRAAGGGEVIEVEFDVRDGIAICEVKVIDGRGRVREITVDARTGRVLEVDDRRGRGRGGDRRRDDD